jgi:hypothetical protein
MKAPLQIERSYLNAIEIEYNVLWDGILMGGIRSCLGGYDLTTHSHRKYRFKTRESAALFLVLMYDVVYHATDPNIRYSHSVGISRKLAAGVPLEQSEKHVVVKVIKYLRGEAYTI